LSHQRMASQRSWGSPSVCGTRKLVLAAILGHVGRICAGNAEEQGCEFRRDRHMYVVTALFSARRGKRLRKPDVGTREGAS